MAVRRVPKDPHQLLVGYEVRWRDEDGKQHRRLFKGQSKRQAEAFFAKTRTDLAAGTYIDTANRTTVTDYARDWVEIQPYRPSSRERRNSQIRTHLEPSRLGKMRLVAVRRSDVQAFATDRDRVLAPESVRGVMRLVSAVFAAAARDRLITHNPCERIALSPPKVARVVPLPTKDVLRLGRALPPRVRVLWLLQASTGLRSGELLALRVGEVDFLRREVHVSEQLHPRTRQRMDVKTPSAVRTVPVPQTAIDALAKHIAGFPSNADGFIFTNERGLPFQHHTYNDIIKKQAQRLGLPHTTTHDARHWYASTLLAAGESVVAVAERLGHANANLVMSTYGHLIPGTEDRTRKAIDDQLTQSAVEVPEHPAEAL